MEASFTTTDSGGPPGGPPEPVGHEPHPVAVAHLARADPLGAAQLDPTSAEDVAQPLRRQLVDRPDQAACAHPSHNNAAFCFDQEMDVVEFDLLTDELRAELEGDEPDPWDAARVRPLEWRPKEQHVALRDDRGRLVASAGMLVAEVSAGDERFAVVGLGGVFVNGEHRGRGLSLRVIEAALAKAGTLGPDHVILFCHEDRAELYRRFGFGEVAGGSWSSSPRVKPDADAHDVAGASAGRELAGRPGRRPQPAVLSAQALGVSRITGIGRPAFSAYSRNCGERPAISLNRRSRSSPSASLATTGIVSEPTSIVVSG